MIRYVLTLLIGSVVFAQTGALTGRVIDPQGGAVVDATVRLLQQSETWRVATDAKGGFAFGRLAAGEFVLEIEKHQFRRESRVVQFTPGMAALQVELEVAGVNQTVLVTSSGAAQVEQETSKAVSVVDSEEILNRNAVSLGDVVRYSPGIQARNLGGIGQLTTFRMRGLRADASAILIDGLRFRDTTTLQADASSFISSLNFVNAERVEVLRGSGSSLYGTNAVGGAVNVVTPQGGGDARGELQLEGGNLGLFRGRAGVSGGLLGDRLKYSGGLLHLNLMNGIDGNDRARSTGGQGFLRYDLTPRISVSARLLGSDDFVQTNISPTTSGIPSANLPASGFINAIPLSAAAVALLNAGGKPDFGNATFVPGRDDPDARRASRFLSSAFVFRDVVNARFNWQASYQRTHTNRVYDDGPAGTGFQPSADNHSQYLGDIDTADVHGTAQLTRFISVTGGYEFERETYNDLQNNNLAGTRQVLEQSHVRQHSNSGYVTSQIALLERKLQISVSGRAQAFDLSKPSFQLTGTANNYDKVALQSPPAAFTGDGSVAYMLARSSTKLRGHFGNAYRAPSLYERFGGGFSSNPATGLVGFTAYGDPRLAPDRYNSVDGGIDQYLFGNRAKISATYFYTRIIHLTAFDFSGIVNSKTDPFGRAYGYINGSGGISRGAEVSVDTRPLRSLTINGSYTYVNANTDRDQSVGGFYKLFSLQPHTLTLVATKHWGRRFDTTVDMFHGSAYNVPFFAVTQTRVYSFPGFTKTGLMANYRVFQGERRSVRAYVKVDNLFNQTYYESGWLAAKATFALGMGYSF